MSEMDAMIDGPNPAPSESQNFDVPPTVPPVSTEPAPQVAAPEAPAAVEPAAVETPPADGSAPAVTPPGLPEGVRVRKLEGKDVWAVEPAAGRSAFDRAALATEAEQIMGEPLTKDAVEFRQRTVDGLEGMRGDLLSDKPEDQLNVVNHLGDVIRQAQAAGEIGHDAVSSLVKVTIDSAMDGRDPALTSAVLSHISSNPRVINTLIENVYQMALTEPDAAQAEALWNSAQQIDNRINKGQYRTNKEMEYLRASKATSLPVYQRQGAAPATAVTAPPQPAAATTSPANTGYQDWANGTNQTIHNDSVVKGVDALLGTSVAKELRDKYPNDLQAVQNQLISVVRDGLLGDQALRDQTTAIQKRARLAVNPEVRDQLRDEIVRRHTAAAKRILGEKKGPILTRFAEQMAGKSATELNRARASQTAGRQAPSSGGPSAARVGVREPSTGQFKSNSDFTKELEGVLG